MKKIVVLLFAVLFVAPAAFAEGWGVGVKLGGGDNNPSDLKAAYGSMGGSKELDTNGAYFGLEAFHEWALADETSKIGAKVGLDFFGENEAETKSGFHEELTETTYSFPFTVYYKCDNGVGAFSWFGGAGATIIRSELEYKGFGENKTSKNKVFPHIVVGGEYRFTQVFALGLEARYNFDAKVKKDGVILSDRTGFGAALTGRFYF